MFSVIITSYNEPVSIKKSLHQILFYNIKFWNEMEVIVVAPDDSTLNSAKEEIQNLKSFTNYKLLKDQKKGKSEALNLAFANINPQSKLLFFTDGDVYLDKDAIVNLKNFLEKNAKLWAGTGQVVSIDDRNKFWGFSSHLFCLAAHIKRLAEPSRTYMSGYLFAIKILPDLFPLPKDLRSEDAYISIWLQSKGLEYGYESRAKVYVKFPKSLTDWLKQKKRSLGGTVQVSKFFKKANNDRVNRRSITEDLRLIVFPFKFAKNTKELLFVFMLFPLRFYLWILIYFQHLFNLYSKGTWERIESSK